MHPEDSTYWKLAIQQCTKEALQCQKGKMLHQQTKCGTESAAIQRNQQIKQGNRHRRTQGKKKKLPHQRTYDPEVTQNKRGYKRACAKRAQGVHVTKNIAKETLHNQRNYEAEIAQNKRDHKRACAKRAQSIPLSSARHRSVWLVFQCAG